MTNNLLSVTFRSSPQTSLCVPQSHYLGDISVCAWCVGKYLKFNITIKRTRGMDKFLHSWLNLLLRFKDNVDHLNPNRKDWDLLESKCWWINLVQMRKLFSSDESCLMLCSALHLLQDLRWNYSGVQPKRRVLWQIRLFARQGGPATFF